MGAFNLACAPASLEECMDREDPANGSEHPGGGDDDAMSLVFASQIPSQPSRTPPSASAIAGDEKPFTFTIPLTMGMTTDFDDRGTSFTGPSNRPPTSMKRT